MSSVNQFILLSEYNKLMNQRLFNSVAMLSDEEIDKDRSAFFGSILGTLNHILVGDVIWLKRFYAHSPNFNALHYLSNIAKPKLLSSILFHDLKSLREERGRMDEMINQWMNELSEKDLSGRVLYKNMAGKEFKKPLLDLLNHLFLHQVHHRGQVTVMLSQSGIDFGDTDLIEIIPNYIE